MRCWVLCDTSLGNLWLCPLGPFFVAPMAFMTNCYPHYLCFLVLFVVADDPFPSTAISYRLLWLSVQCDSFIHIIPENPCAPLISQHNLTHVFLAVLI